MNDNQPVKADETATEDKGPTLSKAPVRELEQKLKKNPQDPDSKTDVGSDESMDASDPVSATQPGGDEPAPSSGFPEKKD
jgi:hypothetical protein